MTACRRNCGVSFCLIPESPVRGVFWPPAAVPLGKRPPARYAGGMPARRPYPSDLSDARWALVEPTLTAWRERERRAGLGIGRPPQHDLRSLLDAILYVGRKRSIITDTLGLLLVALVTAASVQDGPAGRRLLTKAAAAHPTISRAWADSAYRNAVIEHGAALGIDVEVVRRDPATRGFAALPRRWTVERTFGWLMLHRRLARDYEALPARSEAMIHLAMIDLMARRVTGESTPTWRGT